MTLFLLLLPVMKQKTRLLKVLLTPMFQLIRHVWRTQIACSTNGSLCVCCANSGINIAGADAWNAHYDEVFEAVIRP